MVTAANSGTVEGIEVVGVRGAYADYMRATGMSNLGRMLAFARFGTGATIAALRGLGRKAVLILGGEGKGQDFSPLAEPVRQHARQVLLIGRDAALIERALAAVPDEIPRERCPTLEAAVARAAQLARPGEAVLLSPACASFDMFRDYKQRGDVFAAAVRRLE
jgi:UDP-N-acetylmuramoylalanine--D-glutamate ligase